MDILYYLLSAFNNLPSWTRWIFVALALAAVFGIGATLSPMVGLIIAIGLFVVIGLVSLFLFLIRRSREKKAAAFGGDMQMQAGATPAAINDPAKRAQLESLRTNFQKGIERFRAAGKDLYRLPWYVIVGEPGAGKTEAIRHSKVGFPPGMQDEFQGVGGTINMNWWFTNDAIILDTAGRLIFEEVAPGSTSEWRVFLEMLKKNRPHCPINGLLLVIPAESLIKDAPAQIEKKAGKIATQLEQIQKQLDIRFPVYVVVAKCDLLNGFREFFDDLTDASAQMQMMGWSNPDPLDQPFRPQLVDEHIYTVVQRLSRRRLGLLLDPVARSAERRADEVDRLYALPHSINLIAPNLRRYLEVIFTPGEWTSKPLFLRGIYFTSSMREGSSLDQELAQALSMNVEDLPEGKAWERERSYFLRDFFLDKTFRERGLVTRATSATALLLKRRLILFGTGLAGLLAVLAFSVLGYRSLQNSIGRQSGYWARASEDWNGNTWKPIVKRDAGLQFRYLGDEPVGPGVTERTRLLFHDADQKLADFQATLREIAKAPLAISWVYKPISKMGVEIERDRKRAQRIVFEGGVEKPLVDAAREKMSSTPADAKLSARESEREANALLALIRIEAGIVRRQDKKPVTALTAENVLTPLAVYTSDKKPDATLAQTMDGTNLQDGDAAGKWPADWLSGGSTLADNVAINNGLNRFLTDAKRSLQMQVSGVPTLLALVENVRQFAKMENALYAAAKSVAPAERIDAEIFEAFSKLQDARQALDIKISEAQKAGLFGDGPVSLVGAYDNLSREGRTKFETASAIQKEADDILAASNASSVKQAIGQITGQNRERVLFQEIAQKLKPMLGELDVKFRTAFQTDVDELRTLDDLYVADAGNNTPHYRARWHVYEQAIKASPPITYASSLDLIGQDWKPLTDLLTRVEQIRAEMQGYKGKLSEKLIAICGYCLTRAETIHSNEFCKAYLAQAQKKIRGQIRFPFVWQQSTDTMSPEEVAALAAMLDKIKADLHSQNFQAIKAPSKPPLVDFGNKLALLDPVRDALLTPERSLRLCNIVLLSRREQFELSGQQTGMDVYRAIQLRAGTVQHGAVVKYGTPGRVPTDSPSEVQLGRFTLYEPFHFHFHNSPDDQRIAVDMPAPSTWTALNLLFERNATRLGDGTRWHVCLEPAPRKFIWLEFRFDKPLPAFEDWPTKTSLGL